MLLKEVENDRLEQARGWICPKCEGTVAPLLKTCPICEQSKVRESAIPKDKQVLMG
jgi:rubrerythrin